MRDELLEFSIQNGLKTNYSLFFGVFEKQIISIRKFDLGSGFILQVNTSTSSLPKDFEKNLKNKFNRKLSVKIYITESLITFKLTGNKFEKISFKSIKDFVSTVCKQLEENKEISTTSEDIYLLNGIPVYQKNIPAPKNKSTQTNINVFSVHILFTILLSFFLGIFIRAYFSYYVDKFPELTSILVLFFIVMSISLTLRKFKIFDYASQKRSEAFYKLILAILGYLTVVFLAKPTQLSSIMGSLSSAKIYILENSRLLVYPSYFFLFVLYLIGLPHKKISILKGQFVNERTYIKIKKLQNGKKHEFYYVLFYTLSFLLVLGFSVRYLKGIILK